ncbi:MAG: GNAT family acetyltransferase [Mycobacteriales bacterium]
MVRLVDLPDSLTEEAVALWHANGLTRPWNDPHADLRRAVAGPCSTVLAALDEADVLLGTAMVGHDGHRGWVYYLAVRPESQRSGLGRALMQASETWLRDRSVPKVNLMVRTTNSAVIAFYEALGYEDGEVVVLGRFLER